MAFPKNFGRSFDDLTASPRFFQNLEMAGSPKTPPAARSYEEPPVDQVPPLAVPAEASSHDRMVWVGDSMDSTIKIKIAGCLLHLDLK
jgi:hypothetical protein